MPENSPAATRAVAKTVYRFGEFEVRSESGELFRDSVRVHMQEQSLQVLLALLETPGMVVGRDQIQERLWPEGTHVDFEHSLNAAVKRLRAALEDDAEKPRYIETLPRRGYRLIVEVSSETLSGPEGAPVEPSPELRPEPILERRARKGLRWGIASAIVLLIVTVAATIALRLRKPPGLISGATAQIGTVTPSQKGEGYELYLRSLAYKLEPPDNELAINLLERSTKLDPGSARAWYELAHRYHFEHLPGGRGLRFLQLARDANRRALELDPDFSLARLHQVTLDVEAGQMGTAYIAALAMSRAHTSDGNAHFALSYVLRYGGMFEEAAKECEVARTLDSANAAFRSCSLVYILLGRYDRAATYFDADPLSTYVRFRKMELAILANDKTTATTIARTIRLDPPQEYPEARLIEAVLSETSHESVLNWSRQSEAIYDRINESEAYFVAARYQAWAGQTEPALRLLRRAIANNYCSYPVMDSDPMLANIRRLPEYAELRQAGVSCHDSFRTQMQRAR